MGFSELIRTKCFAKERHNENFLRRISFLTRKNSRNFLLLLFVERRLEKQNRSTQIERNNSTRGCMNRRSSMERTINTNEIEVDLITVSNIMEYQSIGII